MVVLTTMQPVVLLVRLHMAALAELAEAGLLPEVLARLQVVPGAVEEATEPLAIVVLAQLAVSSLRPGKTMPQALIGKEV